MQIFENNDEKQYDKISILNSFWIILKRMLSRCRWWKKEFHH
jgi:hypothetical protein